ncbi:MAG: ImmA/IrrE family metallo-endopeptidase, partial [Pseudomonadota bacterium]
MRKTFVGPQLRQLRRQRKQTQAEMARLLGVSASYVNLLENNQRSLSVQVLMALSDTYQVDWRDLVNDESSTLLADLRNAVQDPAFADIAPDLQELRAAIDHAPRLVEVFLTLHRSHHAALERIMRQGGGRMPDEFVESSPEAVIHDFFRKHANHFAPLEQAAEDLRAREPCTVDDVYQTLKSRLHKKHGVSVETRSVEEMSHSLRIHHADTGELLFSEALDHTNRVFQLAHVLCLVEFRDLIVQLTADGGITDPDNQARCHVELANYFAAAYLMPYAQMLKIAQNTSYDIDRIAAAFGVSFEQVCHRLTTLQRDGARGVPFFF